MEPAAKRRVGSRSRPASLALRAIHPPAPYIGDTSHRQIPIYPAEKPSWRLRAGRFSSQVFASSAANVPDFGTSNQIMETIFSVSRRKVFRLRIWKKIVLSKESPCSQLVSRCAKPCGRCGQLMQAIVLLQIMVNFIFCEIPSKSSIRAPLPFPAEEFPPFQRFFH